jgi:hypothetical protein
MADVKAALDLLQDVFDSLQDGESFEDVKGDFHIIADHLGGEIDDEHEGTGMSGPY